MENKIENKNENKSILQTFADELKQNMLENTMLGYEIGKIQSRYNFNSIVEFLKGKTTSCYSFDELKPLYDKYGYKQVNEAILHIDKTYNNTNGEQENE